MVAAAAAVLWCLILTPVQAYVYELSEHPVWLNGLDQQLARLAGAASSKVPGLDAYYIFGRLFLPA